MKKNRKITKMIVASTLILSFLIPSNFVAAKDYYITYQKDLLHSVTKKVTKKEFDKQNKKAIEAKYQENKKLAGKEGEEKSYFPNYFYKRFNDWENYYIPYTQSGLFNTLEYLRSEECEKQWIENCKIATIGFETPHQVGNSKSTSGIHGTYLYKGDSFDLMVKGGSGSYTYTSSKTSVATVDASGIVKAVSKGVAKISIYDTVTTRTKTYYVDVRDKSQKKADDVRVKIYDAMYNWKTSVSLPKKTYSKALVYKAMTNKKLKKDGMKYLQKNGSRRKLSSDPKSYIPMPYLLTVKVLYSNYNPYKACLLSCQTGLNYATYDEAVKNAVHYDIKETKKNITVKIKYPKGMKQAFTKAKSLVKDCMGESVMETIQRVRDKTCTEKAQKLAKIIGKKNFELLCFHYNKIPVIVLCYGGYYLWYLDGVWETTDHTVCYYNEQGSFYPQKNPKIYPSEVEGICGGTLPDEYQSPLPYYVVMDKEWKPYGEKIISEANINCSLSVDFRFSYSKIIKDYIHGTLSIDEILQKQNTTNLDGFGMWGGNLYTQKGYIDIIKDSGLYPDYANPTQRVHDKYTYLNSLANAQ